MIYFTIGKCDKVPLYVLNEAFLGISRITKLGWFDSGQQDIITQVQQIMRLSDTHAILGLSIYASLVQEVSTFNRKLKSFSLARHTRVSSRFKDTALLDIVKTALEAITGTKQQSQQSQQSQSQQSQSQQSQQQSSPPKVTSNEGIARSALKLVLSGISYNFMTSYSDDASDDIATVQIPIYWREMVEDPGFLDVFFAAYRAYGPPVSSTALECVAVLSSVRRSLFTNDEARTRYLASLVRGVQGVLETGAGLDRAENHHMLARLLARMKANYQLSQLAGLPGWERWLALVYQFTVASLQAWASLENSVYYLMSFWSRMVVSLAYLPSKAGPTYVEVYAPKVAEAYIRTRFDSVEYALAGKIDDDYLAEEDLMAEQLEHIPQIARCNYAAAGAFLTAYIDPLLAAARQLALATPAQEAVLLGRAAWFVYLVGALVKARVVSTNTDETDAMDGELVSRVLLLEGITDERNGSSGGKGGDSEAQSKLELAYCYFWLNFRRVYINEANNMNTTSRMFARLSENLGLPDMNAILALVLNKVGSNLLAHRRNARVVERTLDLFHELSTGYSSQHMVARLDVVAQILDNHAAVFGPATWGPPPARDDAKHCTMFYRTLGRLLLTEDHLARFPDFMAPIGAVFDLFVVQPSKEAILAQPHLRAAALCAIHQLRGLFEACSTAAQYSRFFEWFHPRYTLVLALLAELYGQPGGIAAPGRDGDNMFFVSLMKFVLELSWNKGGRIKFDYVSANGIVLFKEVCSPLLVSFGSIIAANPLANNTNTTSGGEALKLASEGQYKNIKLCVKILTNVLSGGYVNLGVFALYKDTCFADALAVVLRIALSIPAEDLIAYEKLAFPIFEFLDAVATVYPAAFLRLPHSGQPLFRSLLLYLSEGLTKSNVSQIVSLSCTTVDGIFAAYVAKKRRLAALVAGNGGKVPTPTFIPAVAAQNEDLAAEVTAFEQNMSLFPEFIPTMLYAMFCVILFTECQYSYTAAKAIYSLAVSAPAKFAEAKAAMIQAQPPVAHQKLVEAFAKLEASIDLAAAAAALAGQTQGNRGQQQGGNEMVGGRTGRASSEKDRFTQALVVFVHDVKLIPGLVPILP